MSRGLEREMQQVGPFFAMLKALRNNAKREGLHFGQDLVARTAIRKNAGEIRNLSDPATVFLALHFDLQLHVLNLVPSRAAA